MISKISGRLDTDFVSDEAIIIICGGLGYEIMMPAFSLQKLKGHFLPGTMGPELMLYTFHYLEGAVGGGTVIPRLIGFETLSDRDFFEKFITVPGIGMKKAIRSLVVPFAKVAAAIEAGDIRFLSSLPEIGKRTAEKIVAELRGRVQEWALEGRAGTGAAAPLRSASAALSGLSIDAGLQEEILAVLLQLGHRRMEAEQMLAAVLQVKPELKSAETIIQEIYRMKSTLV